MSEVCAASAAIALGVGRRGVWPAAAQDATPVVGAPFVAPSGLRSDDGRLDITLTSQLGPTILGGREDISITYNGQALAPTLRLHPGETLGVTLVNHWSITGQSIGPANKPAYPRAAPLSCR